jgi:hypothetical protein
MSMSRSDVIAPKSVSSVFKPAVIKNVNITMQKPEIVLGSVISNRRLSTFHPSRSRTEESPGIQP